MSWNNGLWWPWSTLPNRSSSGSVTLDLTGEYFAIIGTILIDGQATSKTIDTTGSSAIAFSCNAGGTPVFDNNGSEFTVGFQTVDKTTGIPVRPSGIWDGARARITVDGHTVAGDASANTTPVLTSGSDYHVAVPTAGTTTLSHGSEIALVFEFTTRGGADSVILVTHPHPHSADVLHSPVGITNVTGAVAASAQSSTSTLITFSDGTLGMMDGTAFVGGGVTNPILLWNDGSATDEYGLIFQVPFACSVDAIAFQMLFADAASDMTYDLVSTPLGTPASLISGPITLTAEATRGAVSLGIIIRSFAPVALLANTDYAIGVKATGASNLRWQKQTLPSAASRVLLSAAGTTLNGASRNAGSGAYTANTTTLHPCAVRICNIGGVRPEFRGANL